MESSKQHSLLSLIFILNRLTNSSVIRVIIMMMMMMILIKLIIIIIIIILRLREKLLWQNVCAVLQCICFSGFSNLSFCLFVCLCFCLFFLFVFLSLFATIRIERLKDLCSRSNSPSPQFRANGPH